MGIAGGLSGVICTKESAGEGCVCFRADYVDLALIVRVLAGVTLVSSLFARILLRIALISL